MALQWRQLFSNMSNFWVYAYVWKLYENKLAPRVVNMLSNKTKNAESGENFCLKNTYIFSAVS